MSNLTAEQELEKVRHHVRRNILEEILSLMYTHDVSLEELEEQMGQPTTAEKLAVFNKEYTKKVHWENQAEKARLALKESREKKKAEKEAVKKGEIHIKPTVIPNTGDE